MNIKLRCILFLNKGAYEMNITQENKSKIQSNRREIFELETKVNSNKALVHATRATIEQNYTSIMRNYSAAFLGNHNLTTQNTDNIFRNRAADR